MSNDARSLHFTADRGDARLRLDQALVRRIGRDVRLSRTVAQHWIAAGLVDVDGVTARRTARPLQEGARVSVHLPESAPRREAPGAEDLPLDILFQDAYVMAINKPAGAVVHPTYRHATGTLINAVLWHVRDVQGTKPGVLTRLDKDTSGLVLVALSPDVHATVQADARAGRVRKEYVAIVHGRPASDRGTIRLALGRDPKDRRRVVARADGAASETRYEVMASSGGESVLKCELVTGRTHQIRAHLSESGWPIVGDVAYGRPDERIKRQALHAWRVEMPHPASGPPLALEAPLPADMRGLVGDCEALAPRSE